MDSEPSRTYDIKDAAAATTTNAAAVVADVNESDEQIVNTNNQSEFEQIDNNNDNKVDEQENEAYSVDILLNAQLCNSCSKEKATVICTLCISDNTSTPYFNGNNPVVINSLDHGIKCAQHVAADEVKDEGDFVNDCQKDESPLDNDKEIDDDGAPVGDDCNVKSQSVNIEQLIKSKNFFSTQSTRRLINLYLKKITNSKMEI